MTEKPTRGGKREGAGRPHAGNTAYNVRLPSDTMDMIKRVASDEGKTTSAVIQEILDRSLARRKWSPVAKDTG